MSEALTFGLFGKAPEVVFKKPTTRNGVVLGDATNQRHVEEFADRLVDGQVVVAPFGKSTYGYAVDVFNLEAIKTFTEACHQPISKAISVLGSPQLISEIFDPTHADKVTAQSFISGRVARRLDNIGFFVIPVDPDSDLLSQAMKEHGYKYSSLNIISFERCIEASEIQVQVLRRVADQYGVPFEHAMIGLKSLNQSGSYTGTRGVENATTEDARNYVLDRKNKIRMALFGEDTGAHRIGSMPMIAYKSAPDVQNSGWYLHRQGGTPDAAGLRLIADLPSYGGQVTTIERNHALKPLPEEITRQIPSITPDRLSDALNHYYNTGKVRRFI